MKLEWLHNPFLKMFFLNTAETKRRRPWQVILHETSAKQDSFWWKSSHLEVEGEENSERNPGLEKIENLERTKIDDKGIQWFLKKDSTSIYLYDLEQVRFILWLETSRFLCIALSWLHDREAACSNEALWRLLNLTSLTSYFSGVGRCKRNWPEEVNHFLWSFQRPQFSCF